MTYTIYNKEGEKRTDFDSSSSCTHVHKIQSDNVLNLSFTLYDYIVLDVNDYIDIGSDRFTLTDPYKPLMKSTLEYQYDVKFYGAESIAKKAVFLDTEYNPITSYFDTPSAQLSYIVKCINRVIGQERYHVGAVIASEPILVSYQSGCTCLQALDALSKVVKTEWWLDGTSFNLNKCEHSNPVVLGYAKGILQLSKDISENKEFYTRLIPRGSSKNIIASDYGHATLQLPEGVKYIDRDVDNYGIVEHYEEVAFQDIFPRFEGKVMSVRTEQRTIEKIDRIIYYFTDPTIPFNPNDYEQPGKIKHIVFKSGDLQGQDFEANYNAERKEWELILQYPSKDMQLPGGNVIPRLNDIYTVYNIKLPREYYPLAEKEFVDAVNKLLDEHAVDYAVYKATTDSVYLEENNINLSIGQRVKLLSEEYFSEGYRNSRITSITRKLSNLNDMDIDISNTIVKSGYASLKEDVSSLKTAVSERLAQDMLNIIRSYQQADMTDENVLSSKRTLNEIAKNAISKTKKDIAEKEITFKEGLTTDKVESEQFLSGAFGFGMKMWMQNGISYAEIDNLLVRRETIFNKLTIAEIKAIGGQLLITVADIVCNKVEELSTAYRCYFDNQKGTIINPFVAYDQARCQTFNGQNQKYYWRLVVGVGVDYIDLSKSDCDGTGVPAAGDNIIQLGNRTDIARQSAIHESAFGIDAPFSKHYRGINSYSLVGKATRIESATESVYTGDFRIKSGNKVVPIPADIPYVAGQECTYYQRVSYNGALWLCIVEEGKKTTEVPSDSSQAWIKQVDKGANGKPGTDGKDGKDAGINLLNWQEEWKEGALPAGWGRNGSIEENSVIYGENPFKVRSLMWKCTPDVNGESSGGYHTPPMLLDEKYAHRFSTFVFRVRTGNGGVYHGCYGLDDLNDTENGNPYFWSGDLPTTEWYLMVGYIHPKGSVVKTVLSGVYNMKGEKIAQGNDFKFRQPNVEIRPRNYLYYSTMPDGEVYFYNPIMHKLDGTEPSIEQMLQLSARKEIDAAKATSEAYAKAQAELARVKAEANADGKITAAEARAIADATAKANAARDAAINAASADATDKIDKVKTTYDKKFESTNERFLSVITETKTYTNNAVAGVQVGGVNLRSEKGSIQKWLYYSNSNATNSIIECDGYQGRQGYLFSVLNLTQGLACYRIDLDKALSEGGDYTLSFFYKVSKNISCNIEINDCQVFSRLDAAPSWTYIKKSINVSRLLGEYGFIDVEFSENADLYLSCIQVEKGNIATAWTASPNELLAQIDATEVAAKKYADAQAELARTKAEANADGKITAAEARAIADATAKANAARDAAIGAAASDASSKAEEARKAAEAAGRKYVTEKNYATIDQTKDSITLSINNIKVGGNNLFSKNSYLSKLDGEPNFYRSESEAPNGFVMIGAKDRSNGIRINGVIKSNEEYTVSFWAKGNFPHVVYVDICDCVVFRVDFTQVWQKFSFTGKITNYTESVYNFVDFSGMGWVALYVKNLKIEKGNVATDWTLSQEELPTIDTIISSINLSKEEALINAERIRLKGKTVADAIQTDGLNVGDKTSIDKYGNFRTVNATISGSISMPFKSLDYPTDTISVVDLTDQYNIITAAIRPEYNNGRNPPRLRLPNNPIHNGREVSIYNAGLSRAAGDITVIVDESNTTEIIAVKKLAIFRCVQLLPGWSVIWIKIN